MYPARPPQLMIVTETLPLPWLDGMARTIGYEVLRCRSVREAMTACRRRAPDAVLAEFHFNPTYSSFTSSLESLLAGLQKYAPAARLLVLSEPARHEHLESIRQRFEPDQVLDQPVAERQLETALRSVYERLVASARDID